MSPADLLEQRLTQVLQERPAAERLEQLDRRIALLVAHPGVISPSPWRNWWPAFAALVSTVVVVTLAVVVPRLGPAAIQTLDSPSVAVATSTGSEPSSQTIPTPSPSAAPTPSATLEATASPTAQPTATPHKTPRPTNAPATQAPMTPFPVYSGTGSLGQTITVHGVSVTLARTATPGTYVGYCEGFSTRETFAYSFRMDWQDPPGSPYVGMAGVGNQPFTAYSWEPDWAVNRDIVLILCHLPGDTSVVTLNGGADGVPASYQWRFK